MSCSLNDLTEQAKRLRLTPMLNHAKELDLDPNTALMSHADWLKVLLEAECLRRVSSEQIYPQRKRQKLPSPSFLSFLLFSVVLFKFLF